MTRAFTIRQIDSQSKFVFSCREAGWVHFVRTGSDRLVTGAFLFARAAAR